MVLLILFRSMQDDPDQFADLQRAKYLLGLGHPLRGEVLPSQVKAILAALDSVPRADGRRRLDLVGDGPDHERLQARWGMAQEYDRQFELPPEGPKLLSISS
jgi:hypothetical protein